MEKIKLDELCKTSAGQIKEDTSELIDYIDIASVDNDTKRVTGYQTLTFGEAPSRARKIVKKGSILVSTVRPNLNAVAMLEEETSNRTIASTGFCILDCKENVDSRFVFNYCKSKTFVDQMVARTTGASYPAVSDKIVREALVPKYSYEEQCYISDVLDNINSIIDKRKVELSNLDKLIKARFIEMTEHTKTVPMRMGDIASYVNGYAFKPTDWKEVGKPIIRIKNLNDALAKYNYYDGELADKYKVSFGDVLVSWATHLEAYIWKGEEAWLNQHIFKVLFDKVDVDKTYFIYATEEALRQAFRNAHGFKPTMEHIKRSDFENAVVKLPAFEVQQQFADFVHQVNKLKVATQKALDETQLLFNSLMQEYFG